MLQNLMLTQQPLSLITVDTAADIADIGAVADMEDIGAVMEETGVDITDGIMETGVEIGVVITIGEDILRITTHTHTLAMIATITPIHPTITPTPTTITINSIAG